MNTKMVINLLNRYVSRSILTAALFQAGLLYAESSEELLEKYAAESKRMAASINTPEIDSFYARWAKKFESLLAKDERLNTQIYNELIAIKTAQGDFIDAESLLTSLIEVSADPSYLSYLKIKRISLRQHIAKYVNSPESLSLAFAEVFDTLDDYVGNPLVVSSFLVEYGVYIDENSGFDHAHSLSDLFDKSASVFKASLDDPTNSGRRKQVIAESVQSLYFLRVKQLLLNQEQNESDRLLVELLSMPFSDGQKLSLILSHGALISSSSTSEVAYFDYLERNIELLEQYKALDSLIQLGMFYNRRNRSSAAASVYSIAESLYAENPSLLKNKNLLPWLTKTEK